MDSELKKTLLGFLLETDNADLLIEKINRLHKSDGSLVLQTLFKLLAGANIAETDIERHWNQALCHRQEMIKKLGRSIDFTTTLSDYLQTSTTFLNHPRLVETSFYEDVVQQTIHDKLTNLFNRPYFDEAMQQHIALSKRYQNLFSILFLDLDNFKDVNDTYGHLAGDEALRSVAEIIGNQKRDSDIAARYGGEEFVILMPNTDNISSFVFAERLRQKVEKLKICHEKVTFNLTISGGIASFPFNTEDPAQLLQMADSALYISKGAGKNRISHYKDETRRYLRKKVAHPVLVKELNFDEAGTFNGVSKNICIGGILFENPEPMPLGALIKVQVPVSDESPVILIGTVVRIETLDNGNYDIGMTSSFKELDKIVSEEIGGIVQDEDMP